MQKCILNGKFIYAFDCWNEENNVIDVKLEEMWKDASKQGKLKCCEYGTNVIFKLKNS